MPSPLEQIADIESVIGADLQTRIPDTVRLALQLNAGDRLRYRIGTDGRVSLENASRPAASSSANLSPLLGMLAGLMTDELAGTASPLTPLDASLVRSLQGLIGGGAKLGNKAD